eukprot:GFYU01001894.1.p1 GENE.GFYU01001894.1~~GFYU01001894.1.p1  ORF type:complete len:399 (-),score=101.14 GFYU01001894.1:39-1133(-)
MPFISAQGLEAIANHKYVSGGYSWLDNKFNPFWVACVELLPMWLAPNLVTLIGLLCVISSYAVIMVHAPTLTEACPSWVYFFCAFAQFAYQTLDAIDGKQARRTGASSPLGQLFDHGCDAFGCTFTGAVICATIQFGVTPWTIAVLMLMQVPFFLAQWEEYHLGTLRTNIGFFGVTEGQVIILSLIGLTGVFGPEFWHYDIVGGFTIRLLLLSGVGYGAISMGSTNFFDVMKSATDKNLAFSQLMPMANFVAFVLVMTLMPDSLYYRHPHWFLLFICAMFTYFTVKMIIHSMAKMPYPSMDMVLVPMPFVFTALFLGYGEIADVVFYIWVVYAVLNYFYYVSGVIDEITRHLGIYCFIIGKRDD